MAHAEMRSRGGCSQSFFISREVRKVRKEMKGGNGANEVSEVTLCLKCE